MIFNPVHLTAMETIMALKKWQRQHPTTLLSHMNAWVPRHKRLKEKRRRRGKDPSFPPTTTISQFKIKNTCRHSYGGTSRVPASAKHVLLQVAANRAGLTSARRHATTSRQPNSQLQQIPVQTGRGWSVGLVRSGMMSDNTEMWICLIRSRLLSDRWLNLKCELKSRR